MRAQISYVTDRQKRDKDYPWLFILLLQTQPLYQHASYTAFEWKHSQSLLDQLLELIVRKLRSKHMQAGGLHAHGVDTSTDRRDFCAHAARCSSGHSPAPQLQLAFLSCSPTDLYQLFQLVMGPS